jgi:hypothetical protein
MIQMDGSITTNASTEGTGGNQIKPACSSRCAPPADRNVAQGIRDNSSKLAVLCLAIQSRALFMLFLNQIEELTMKTNGFKCKQ